MPVTIQSFLQDPRGNKFASLVSDPGVPFQDALHVLNRPDVVRRMKESEIHHDRPALGGAVRELENVPSISAYFAATDGHASAQFHRAVGVVVLLQMEAEGWHRTGTKGRLGTRAGVRPRTTRPGAYRNKRGPSAWFVSSERYVAPAGMPFPPVNAPGG